MYARPEEVPVNALRRTGRTRPSGPLLAGLAVVVCLGATLGTAAPASAHRAGKAVVQVRDLTLTPDLAGRWAVVATIADLDSGVPIAPAAVQVLYGSAGRAVPLTQAMGGRYVGTLDEAVPGPAQIGLTVRKDPAGPAVVPYDGRWKVELDAAGSTLVARDAAEAGGSALPFAGVVIVGLLAYVAWYLRRHRSP